MAKREILKPGAENSARSKAKTILMMESDQLFHPRYSVRGAFDEGMVSVAGGRYAASGSDPKKPIPNTMTCYNPDGRKPSFAPNQTSQVQGGRLVEANYPEVQSNPYTAARGRGTNRTRMDRTRQDPNPGDRRYWKSKDVVTNKQIVANETALPAEMILLKGKPLNATEKKGTEVVTSGQRHSTSKPRWQVLPYHSNRRPRDGTDTSTKDDREHWKGQTVVQGPRQFGRQVQRSGEPALGEVHPVPPNKIAPLGRVPVEAMTRPQLNKMGRRENNIQRQIRQRLTVKTESGMEVELPVEALDGDEFTLVVPAGVDLTGQLEVKSNPLPSHLGLDTLKEIQGHAIADDEDARQNRGYWGGRQVVANKGQRFASKNE